MTTEPKPKSNAGRKPIADPLKKKQRNMYLTEREWIAVQFFVSHNLRKEPLPPMDKPTEAAPQ